MKTVKINKAALYQPDAEIRKLSDEMFAHSIFKQASEDFAKECGLHKTDLVLLGKVGAMLKRGEPVKRKWLKRYALIKSAFMSAPRATVPT